MSKKDTSSQSLEEINYRYKRALADYQNLQRRYESEKTAFIDFANSNLITKLLTVLDHLKLANNSNQDQGLAIAITEFDSVLKEEGLEKVNALGQLFDPKVMEAIELTDGEKDKVIVVIADGYLLNGKLLRPAKVQVGKG